MENKHHLFSKEHVFGDHLNHIKVICRKCLPSSEIWTLSKFCIEHLSKTFQIINHFILKSKFLIANEIFPEWPVPEQYI